MPVRRNQAFLTSDEKVPYISAVGEAKRRGWYDGYVQQHAMISYYAHGGPSFLPWHRYFILLFEKDLQRINPNVTLPYWDWTVDRTPTSSIWGRDFMGPNGETGDGKVLAGPFAYDSSGWTCISAGGLDVPPYLRRQFPDKTPVLPTAALVDQCLQQTPYDSPPWDVSSQPSFRNFLEMRIHTTVHTWVGGNMGILSSPNDPVFFLHHCNTDRLWAQWQQQHPDGYLPKSGGPPGQNQPDLMRPWDGSDPNRASIASVLDHRALGYVYDTEYPDAEGDRMLPGDVLRPNKWITSHNALYSLYYHPAGYVGVFQRGGTNPQWWTPTAPGGMLVMTMDGDLVLQNAQGGQVWHSGSSKGNPGSRLYMMNDGTVTILTMAGNSVWNSRMAAEVAR